MTESVDVVALKYGTMQIVSAIDAFHHFGLRADRTILVSMPRLANTSCANTVGWSSVHVVDDRARGPRWWRRLVRYKRYLDAVRGELRGRPVDQLFIGLYGREMCAVANALRPRMVTVLDDGTSTVVRSRSRAADLRAGKFSAAPPATQFIRRLVGLDARHLQRVRFYSMMEPELMDGDEFVPCRLSSFVQQVRSAQIDQDRVWILGTNLVENGYVDLDLYARILVGLANRERRNNSSVVLEYHAHPGERADKVHALSAELGLCVVSSSDPIELRVIETAVLPGGGVVSFPSTALVSIRTLLPPEIPCGMVGMGGIASWPPLQVVEQSLMDQLGDDLSIIDVNDLL
jgi:hypothetical protein